MQWHTLLSATSVAAFSPQALPFDEYVAAQTKVALFGILDNTYGVGSDYPGVIIASPATDTAPAGQTGGQNYYYQWTRDAALTLRTLINQYASGDDTLEPFIKAYIENERELQHLTTLSGNFTSGGLAEPKYYVNSTAFNEPWGRPQRDGPALRATAIMGFLSLQADAVYVKNITETIVKPDLDYVAKHWQDEGFDLWEEQDNLHFFTAMVQARALHDGAQFMTLQGDSTSAQNYEQQGNELGSLVDSFWNSTGTGTFDAQLNLTKPTGADCANLIAANHGGNATQYPPSSDRILASLSTLLDEMTGLYPIDAGDSQISSPPAAISVGRYPSDVYDGITTSQGNPWFLCNSAVAETLYLAATELNTTGSVTVTSTNQRFFERIQSQKQHIGTTYDDASLQNVIEKMRIYGDGFLAIEQRHVGVNFSMAEEFNRTSGYQQGARDLTWSYAAFVTATRARDGQLTYDFATGHAGNVAIQTTTTTTIVDVDDSNGDALAVASAASRTFALSSILVTFVLLLYLS